MNVDPKNLLFTDLTPEDAAALYDLAIRVEAGEVDQGAVWRLPWMVAWRDAAARWFPNEGAMNVVFHVFPARAYRSLAEHYMSPTREQRRLSVTVARTFDRGVPWFGFNPPPPIHPETAQAMAEQLRSLGYEVSPPQASVEVVVKGRGGVKPLPTWTPEELEAKTKAVQPAHDALRRFIHKEKFTVDDRVLLRHHCLIEHFHGWVLTSEGRRIAEHLGYL